MNRASRSIRAEFLASTGAGLLLCACAGSSGVPSPSGSGTGGFSGSVSSGGSSGSLGGSAGSSANGGAAASGGSVASLGGTAGSLSNGGAGATLGGVSGSAAAGGLTTSAGASSVAGASGTAGSAGNGAAGAATGSNLFTSLLGKTTAEVSDKVTTAVNRFFGIGTNEPATPTLATGYRCYYELPQDPTQAFIWAADSNDIRSEGMSYGMMLAVQMNLHDQFDKLWKFAKTNMQYPSSTALTAWKYYFRWQGTANTANASSWTISFGASTVPAPDGDEYFAASLYLADKRWGSAGTNNYKQEADNLSSAMLHNVATADSRYPLISTTQNMVVFVPYGDSNGFTDPSYHLPAFYELFAADGPSADSAKWKSLATTSRTFLVSSANGSTGLHPDYALFSGAPTNGAAGDGHNQFKYDAWRVVMNMAVDYAWFSSSTALKAQVEKYQTFFTSYLASGNVTSSLFLVDGSMPTGGGSTALTGTLAAGSLASSAANRASFVGNLWTIAQQQGQFRYYQECLYLLALLNVSGNFRHSF